MKRRGDTALGQLFDCPKSVIFSILLIVVFIGVSIYTWDKGEVDFLIQQENALLEEKIRSLNRELQQTTKREHYTNHRNTQDYRPFCELLQPNVPPHSFDNLLTDYNIQENDEYSQICTLKLSDILAQIKTVDLLNGFCVSIYDSSSEINTRLFEDLKLEGKILTPPQKDVPKTPGVNVGIYTSPSFTEIRSILYKPSEKETPWDADVLTMSIDIKNCDRMLETALGLSSFKTLVLDFNPMIPPPIIMSNNRTDQKTFYGCSLSAYSKIAKRFGYTLLQAEFWRAYFIRTEYLLLFNAKPTSDLDVWTKAYWNQPFAYEFLASKYSTDLTDISRAYWFDYKALTSWTGGTDLMTFYTNLRNFGASSGAKFHLYVEQKRFTPGRKRFVYAVQQAGGLDEALKSLNGPDSDVVALSYKEERNDTYYFPKSSWTDGRNKMFELIKEKEIKQGWKYDFITFLDGDVAVAVVDLHPGVDFWRVVEQYLHKYQPAVSIPDYRAWKPDKDVNRFGKAFEALNMFHHDAMICSYHREAADLLLPYVSKFDSESWWYSQLLIIYKSFLLYRPYMYQFYTVYSWNTKHDPYPRETDFQVRVDDYIKNDQSVPERMRTCATGVGEIFRLARWGNPSPKTFDYSTRTYYNVEPCRYDRLNTMFWLGE